MSFYGRMASTASRLLTQYGKPVVLERITSVFNPITGMDTSRTVAESTTTGVEIPIRDALVDGTRVKAGDRFLIVDASIEPDMSDRLKDAPFISCAYPMDATLAEIQALLPSIDAVPVMTDDFQTATYTLTGSAPAGGWEVVCAPTITPPGPATVDFSSGVKAFEWAYSMPVIDVAGMNGPNCSADLSVFYASNFSEGIVRVRISSRPSSSVPEVQMTTYRLGVYVGGPSVVIPATGRISIVMDSSAGTFQVIHDTLGPIALSDDSYNPAEPCIFSAHIREEYGVQPVDAGKDIVASLITNASDMTGTYPTGTTDICGTPL